MGRTRAMACVFLFVSLFVQATIEVSSTSSHLTPESLDSEGYAAKRTLKQEEQYAHEVHCSRERSRAAWKVIEEYLMPFVEREKYQISRKCKLHPDNDIFRDQEQHKIHVDVNEWHCGYYLCGALHCDLVMDSNSKFRKTKCNPAAAARNHHLCESLADSCFPVNQSPSANRLHELFLRQFCDAHTCSGGRKPFSRGGQRNEKRNPRAEANLTTWTKNEALLVGKFKLLC